MNILVNVNLNKNQIQNVVLHPLGQPPASPTLGQIYFNTTDLSIYQYNGVDVGWIKVGVVYNQSSSTGAVITGLSTSGSVTTNNVTSLTLTGYTPIDEGYITPNMSLQQAFTALEEAVKDAMDSGQNAWSYINAGGTTITASAKTDTFIINGSNGATVSGDAATKTITVNVPVDNSLNSSSTNPVQNKIINTALSNKADKTELNNYLLLSGGTMTGAINMGSNAITNIPDASVDSSPVAYGQLPTTPVVTDFDLSYNGDTVTINKDYINVKTGATSSDDEVISLANGTTAGLMSPTSVNAISDLQDRVQALEGTTVRLLYSTKENPTATEIEAFVRAEGYTDSTKWSGIAVVVAGTYHIWHYYSGGVGWRDDGVDTVSQFTNNTLGIIKGSTVDGQVYAEDDGTGSLNGWDALKTRVTNVENNKADQSDVDSIPIVKVATKTLSKASTSVTVSYTGTVINAYVKDSGGAIVLVDIAIQSDNVTFTTAQTPPAALTCVVVYI